MAQRSSRIGSGPRPLAHTVIGTSSESQAADGTPCTCNGQTGETRDLEKGGVAGPPGVSVRNKCSLAESIGVSLRRDVTHLIRAY